MTWIEKTKKVIEFRGTYLAEVERRAGWATGTLSAKMGQDNMPGSDLGTKLARALGVPAYWLFDDADESWPPPGLTMEMPSGPGS